MDSYPSIYEALRDGYSAWVQDGHDAAEFQRMLVDWTNRGPPMTSTVGTHLLE